MSGLEGFFEDAAVNLGELQRGGCTTAFIEAKACVHGAANVVKSIWVGARGNEGSERYPTRAYIRP